MPTSVPFKASRPVGHYSGAAKASTKNVELRNLKTTMKKYLHTQKQQQQQKKGNR